MKQLCWLTRIERSGHLPITVCELLYGNEPIQALVTADTASRYPYESGLVEISYETNQQGLIIIDALVAVPAMISYELYYNAISRLNKGRLPLLTRFVGLLGFITDPCLHRFVSYWSTHPEQFNAFITMPASYQDHHAFPHGLLVHSLEVAELAYSNALRLHHPTKECQLALVAGLFHDLGKIYSQTEAGIHSYQTGAHECLNFALLAAPMEELAREDWDCHRMLSSMLAPYFLQASDYRGFKVADRMSMSCIIDKNARCLRPRPPSLLLSRRTSMTPKPSCLGKYGQSCCFPSSIGTPARPAHCSKPFHCPKISVFCMTSAPGN